MYPLKFEPIYKQMLWGGDKLREIFGRDIPGDDTGESWDLSCHRNGMSVVSNGAFAGKTLREMLATFGSFICGKKGCNGEFPLLVKLIDANDNLSVQVHPNDGNADRGKGESGKTEAWYVLEAASGAELIYGLQEGITRDEFARLVAAGETGRALRRVAVKAGDIISVPAGVVHALTSGVLVAEVQQNSDTTYRIYDYDRRGADGKARELHVEAALRVIDFGNQPPAEFSERRIETPYFAMSELQLDGNHYAATNDGFVIYIVARGNGSICWAENGQHRCELLTAGETILVPACLKEVILTGQMTLVEAR